jgi:hypothetical protein
MFLNGDEAAVLRRLARILVLPAGDAWQQLAAGGRFGAAAAFFLLDAGHEDEAEEFAMYTLGRLVQSLNRRCEAQQVEHEGQVRGRIVWPATFKARYGQDYHPARYVCREVQREYDTPENQLVRYVIERLAECLKGVPAALRAGFYYREPVLAGSPHPAASRLESIGAALARLGRSPYLRQVTLPARITEVHLLRAETADLDEYRAVVRFYHAYRHFVVAPTWEQVADAGRRVLPLPRRVGDEDELWIQLAADILRAGLPARP